MRFDVKQQLARRKHVSEDDEAYMLEGLHMARRGSKPKKRSKAPQRGGHRR